MMRMKPFIMDAVLRTKIGSRVVNEGRYRIILSATGSLCINIAYALYHGILGMIHLSAWFIVMWAYYMILGATRFCAVLCEHKNNSASSVDMEYFVMSVSGVLLLLLSFVLMGVIYISLSQNIATEYDTITMITIATYTFSKIAISIVKAVKQRRLSSPLLTAIINIGFAEVAASVFTLQRSMIVSFGGMEYELIMDILTGTTICLFVMVLGIKMIIKSRKERKRWQSLNW